MLMSLAFLQQGKVKKSKNLLQGNNGRKSAYLPNDLRNFNKIVNKNVHNIKSPEKWGFRLLSRKYSLWGWGGGGVTNCPSNFFRVKDGTGKSFWSLSNNPIILLNLLSTFCIYSLKSRHIPKCFWMSNWLTLVPLKKDYLTCEFCDKK